MSDHRQRAKDLLVHYFETIAKRAGMKWDRDYTAEIECVVDDIIDAAVEAARNEICDDLDNYIKPEAMR